MEYLLLSPISYARKRGVTIGDRCSISTKDWGSEPYLITIGNHVQVTSGVKFFTHGGGWVLRDKYPDFDCFGKIVIGNNVYVGNNVLILPGVTIGDNVVIGAGSIVTKSIPSECVVAGNPATIKCTIEEYSEKMIKYNLGTKRMNHLQKKQILLNNNQLFISK